MTSHQLKRGLADLLLQELKDPAMFLGLQGRIHKGFFLGAKRPVVKQEVKGVALENCFALGGGPVAAWLG